MTKKNSVVPLAKCAANSTTGRTNSNLSDNMEQKPSRLALCAANKLHPEYSDDWIAVCRESKNKHLPHYEGLYRDAQVERCRIASVIDSTLQENHERHIDDIREQLACAKWDIDAYRGALGYPVPGNHTGKLTSGETPTCGLCRARAIAQPTTPNAALPPFATGPTRKMVIEIFVSADFEKRLDNQWEVEREINADRWNWRWADEKEQQGADLYEANQKLRNVERILEGLGYRRCNIPACNCNSYHPPTRDTRQPANDYENRPQPKT